MMHRQAAVFTMSISACSLRYGLEVLSASSSEAPIRNLPIELARKLNYNPNSKNARLRLCCNESSLGLKASPGGGAGIGLQIHYGHSRNCMTSVIPHLLPIRNSLPSTSTLSEVTPKAPRRR
jgi:hypothetical protein